MLAVRHKNRKITVKPTAFFILPEKRPHKIAVERFKTGGLYVYMGQIKNGCQRNDPERQRGQNPVFILRKTGRPGKMTDQRNILQTCHKSRGLEVLKTVVWWN